MAILQTNTSILTAVYRSTASYNTNHSAMEKEFIQTFTKYRETLDDRN